METNALNKVVADKQVGAEGITEFRRQENLLKTGALQDAIFNSANFSSIATDEKGVIQIFNVGAERMLGYAAFDVVNQITPADISDPQELIARATALSAELDTPITPGFEALVFKASRGIEDIYELTYIRKDGSRFPAIVSVTALRDAQEKIIGYLLIGTDNTARKQVEEARELLDQRLRDQQFYTRSLIESNIDALMTTDPQGIISDVNEQMMALTGRTRDELIGAPCKNFFTDPNLADAAIKRVLVENKVRNYELTVRALNGEETVVSYNAATFHDRDRNLKGVFAAARDITERKRFDLTLQQKNVELEHASRMKSEFLATMSHELRTPLNAIIGFSEALQDGPLGQMSEMQGEYIGDIFASGQHLLSLINDILDLSKIEAGHLDIEKASLSVADVMEKTCGMLDQLAIKKDVTFTLFVDPAIPTNVLGDALRLRQILINLVSNAIKFSSGRSFPGHISVRANLLELTDSRADIIIHVQDDGIGMNDLTQAQLFTAFNQADTSTTRRFGGTGLGLVISRHLVDLMGGCLSLKSKLDVGSKFSVQLPFELLPDVNQCKRIVDIAELDCIVVGDVDTLASDMTAYLQHEGARVQTSIDLIHAQIVLREMSGGPLICIIDSGITPSSYDDLKAFAIQLSHLSINFVVIGRGSLRKPSVRHPDLIFFDGNVLTRRRLFAAVALAGGRAIDDQHILSAAKNTPVLTPSRDEAMQAGCLILIAEDNETNQKVLVRQLAMLGFAADIAANGTMALSAVATGRYALLLTDLHMPEMDGYELAAAIRLNEGMGSRLPIVALTANALTGEADRCHAAGMDGYLCKPLPLADLKAALAKWLPNYKLLATVTDVLDEDVIRPTSKASLGILINAVNTSEIDAEEIFERPSILQRASPVIDVSVLKSFVGDNAEVICSFLLDFKNSAAKIDSAMKIACAQRDAMQAGAHAHKLKSSASAVGALQLAELCAVMDSAGRNNDIDAVNAIFPVFQRELAAVSLFLQSQSAPMK